MEDAVCAAVELCSRILGSFSRDIMEGEVNGRMDVGAVPDRCGEEGAESSLGAKSSDIQREVIQVFDQDPLGYLSLEVTFNTSGSMRRSWETHLERGTSRLPRRGPT